MDKQKRLKQVTKNPDFPNFKVSEKEAALIRAIVDRAAKLAWTQGLSFSSMEQTDRIMDLKAWHNLQALDLEKFLDFDDFNFCHDFFGIVNHLDRVTGDTRHFLPRCSR